jgi:hypothetical protein
MADLRLLGLPRPHREYLNGTQSSGRRGADWKNALLAPILPFGDFPRARSAHAQEAVPANQETQ